jgi:hypothetical protein
MKATFDLPDELVRQLKLRALRDGQKLKEAAANALRAGLEASSRPTAPAEKPAQVVKDKRTGLPVVQCRRAASRAQEPTPERVAEILIAQEADWTA